MFRDQKDALRRLEEELLKQEQPEEEAKEDLLPDGDDPTDFGEDPPIENFANHYGAYNADRTDADLDELSREVYDPPVRRHAGLGLAAALLLLASALGWLYLRSKGMLP